MGCFFSSSGKTRSRKKNKQQRDSASDSDDEGETGRLLVLEAGPNGLEATGKSQHPPQNSIHVNKIKTAMKRVDQILDGLGRSETAIVQHMNKLKQEGLNAARPYAKGRPFDANIKMRLSQIRHQLNLQNSLLTSVRQKQTMLHGMSASAAHLAFEQQVFEQVEDSGMMAIAETHMDQKKVSATRQTFVKALESLRENLEGLTDDGDEIALSNQEVGDFVTEDTTLQDDNSFKSMVDSWSEDLNPTMEYKERPKVVENVARPPPRSVAKQEPLQITSPAASLATTKPTRQQVASF